MTTRTQKTTKVTEGEKVEALADFKRDIRSTNPNLSEKEIDRRARFAAGLSSFKDLQTEDEIDLDDLPEGRTKRASKATGRAAAGAGRKLGSTMTSGKAQKFIFGIMILTVGIQLISDIIAGRNRQIDVIPRRMFAGSLAGIMLMLLAVVVPRVALGLAVLMALTTLLYQGRGIEVLEKLTKRAGVSTGGTVEGSTPDNGKQTTPNRGTSPGVLPI